MSSCYPLSTKYWFIEEILLLIVITSIDLIDLIMNNSYMNMFYLSIFFYLIISS